MKKILVVQSAEDADGKIQHEYSNDKQVFFCEKPEKM